MVLRIINQRQHAYELRNLQMLRNCGKKNNH